MCSNSPKFGVKDMDPIDFLCNLSGQSREQCIQYYEISNYDLNTAAMIILESNNPLPQEETITNQSQSSYSLPPLATPASPASLSTLPPVSSRIHPSPASFTSSTSNLIETIDISEICAKFHEQKWSLEDEEEASLTAAAIAAVEDADELPNSSFLTTNTDVFPDNYYHNFKILIPRYRLDEVFDKLIPPQTIELHEIWNSNEILPIPGGMTICEVCSNNLDEMESYLASLAQILGRYHMSHCFILDTITNKQKRKEFLIQMKNIFSNLFQIESKELHHEFIEQGIFRCSILHDDEIDETTTTGELGSLSPLNTTSHSLASVLTITLTGLPEMILTIHEVIKNIASLFSNSRLTGNGSLSCIPDEWSLRCHMVPYSLVLLPQGGEEWNKVLTLGQWNSKTPSSVIKCIHRVENVELWRGYCAKRDAIERLRGDANECWYWHGTRQLSPEIIAKEGFDFRVANSGYYGRGAYFAHSVNYSANSYYYVIQQAPAQLPQTPNNPFQTPNRAIRRIISPSRHSHPFPAPVSPIPAPNPPGQQSPGTFQSIMEFPPGVGAGDSQLILARVCVGNTIVMPSNNQALTRPPDGYDSVTGRDIMTIVYDLAMAYPSYIITYR